MNRAEFYIDKPYEVLMFDELEDYLETIEGLTNFIAENRSTGVAYHNRAVAHAEIGQIDEALGDFARAEGALPESHVPSKCKGMMLRRLGRLDEAILALDRAVEIAPSEVTARRARAYILIEAERLEEALPDLDYAIQLEPTFRYTIDERNKVLAKLKDRDR